MTDQQVSELGKAIQDVSEKLQLLVREEIALAQAEMTEKLQKLIRGIVAGAIAGVFALAGLIYALHSLSWGIWVLTDIGDGPWFGYLVVTLLLFLFGAIGGLLAFRFIKKATPPTPAMAIEEAQLIRETVSGSQELHSGTSVPERVPR